MDRVIIKTSSLVSKEDIMAAYEAGRKHYNEDVSKSYDVYWSYYTPLLNVAYSIGREGKHDLSNQPDVSGWRYGPMPLSGISTNYRDNISERGLSLMSLDDDEKKEMTVPLYVDEMLMGHNPKFYYTGLLLPYKGSDGEPLILPYNVVDNKE